MLKKVKCKDCQRYSTEHTCLWLKKGLKVRIGRSAGRKRDCLDFIQKYVEKKPMRLIRLPWRSKQDIRKERQLADYKEKKRKEMQGLVDQQKLEQMGKMPMSAYDNKPIKLKRPNIFKRVFSRLRDK